MSPDIRPLSDVTWDREVAVEFRADLLSLMDISLV